MVCCNIGFLPPIFTQGRISGLLLPCSWDVCAGTGAEALARRVPGNEVALGPQVGPRRGQSPRMALASLGCSV